MTMASTTAAHYERATFLEPRRVLTLNAARRRTRFIRFLRLGLAAGMVGILAGIASEVLRQSSIATGPGAARPVDEREVVRMINPRFTGRDTAGSPYIINADAAVRRADQLDRSELESPSLTFEDPENPSTFVRADHGVFHREEGALDLRGNVQFESSAGYSFTTESARVFLREGRVVGDSPVSGEGPLGAISAQSFEVVDSGESVHFRGEVVSRINQEPRLAPPLDDAGYDATLDGGEVEAPDAPDESGGADLDSDAAGGDAPELRRDDAAEIDEEARGGENG